MNKVLVIALLSLLFVPCSLRAQREAPDIRHGNRDYKKENFSEVTDEEVEFELAKLAEQYKMTIDNVRKAIENQMGEFRNNIVMSRVENFLFTNND